MFDKKKFSLSTSDFNEIVRLIHDHVGISLSDTKKDLVYNRLQSRLRLNKLNNFSEYIHFLRNESSEWEFFINALTTNLTSFFREAYHFKILSQHVHTNLLKRQSHDPIKIWCAACSTGEEAYSLAMCMIDVFGTQMPPVKILATDLNTAVLSKARLGIYSEEDVSKLNITQRSSFFIKDKNKSNYIIKPEVKALISFKKLNLCDKKWPMTKIFDVIFCRNVLIYFDKKMQNELLVKFSNYMESKGLLFVGHSECFPNMSKYFTLKKQTTYERV
ncbi:MAG: chemotaxis protein CheR [Psychromonas sp.]|nr:chemotaxis protein CheR [Psychromonas sp.]